MPTYVLCKYQADSSILRFFAFIRWCWRRGTTGLPVSPRVCLISTYMLLPDDLSSLACRFKLTLKFPEKKHLVNMLIQHLGRIVLSCSAYIFPWFYFPWLQLSKLRLDLSVFSLTFVLLKQFSFLAYTKTQSLALFRSRLAFTSCPR